MKPTQWHGCYDQQWAGVITPESMAHPAKFSRGLIERIYRHCLERGYLKRGDLVGDCFGGVGCGGVMAAYAGLRWVGVELEPRFVAMAKANFSQHVGHLNHLHLPIPEIIQGDSRQFDRLVGQACGIVSSPPFVAQMLEGGTKGKRAGNVLTKWCEQTGRNPDAPSRKQLYDCYGTSPGQIGALPAGDLAAVVSSPPWQENTEGGMAAAKWKDPAATAKLWAENTNPKCHPQSFDSIMRKMEKDNERRKYGDSPGQIARLKGGELQAVVSSPPYAEGLGHGGASPACEKLVSEKQHAYHLDRGRPYGNDSRQIVGEGQATYWQAVRDVYAACWRAIKPGGVMVLVLKDYVKNRKRVPLADDTVTLCESLGFRLIERIQAMLVSETRHPDLFNGEDVKTKSRKSFFRRLAESKGSPAIDHEDVLIFCRP